jgi:hypothetical protein
MQVNKSTDSWRIVPLFGSTGTVQLISDLVRGCSIQVERRRSSKPLPYILTPASLNLQLATPRADQACWVYYPPPPPSQLIIITSKCIIVAIAASVPNLQHLSLDKIARSAIYTSELIGVYPFVPVVSGDADIPDHPVLGSGLSLPSLLRLSTLRKLKVRDTHLGHPNWSLTPIHHAPQFPDPGSRYHMSPNFNRVRTERIVGNVGPALDKFSLNTALTREAFEKPKETLLCKLRKIYLTLLFPVENVVDTLAILSGSPVKELSVRCHDQFMMNRTKLKRSLTLYYSMTVQLYLRKICDTHTTPHRRARRIHWSRT